MSQNENKPQRQIPMLFIKITIWIEVFCVFLKMHNVKKLHIQLLQFFKIHDSAVKFINIHELQNIYEVTNAKIWITYSDTFVHNFIQKGIQRWR